MLEVELDEKLVEALRREEAQLDEVLADGEEQRRHDAAEAGEKWPLHRKHSYYRVFFTKKVCKEIKQ